MENWIDTHITLPLHVTISEEKENAISHFFGLALAIVGFFYVVFSSGCNLGMVVFAISNIVLYTASAFYHALSKGTAKKILRVFDHSAIYILIAGSYTPVLLHVATPLTKAYALFMWAITVLGILLTLRFWGRLYVLHVILYGVMGWSIVFFWNSVIPSIPAGLLRYMLLGGITYTVGMIFYGVKKIPHNHLIWHIFVLAGSIFFFVGYSLYLLA